MRVHILGHNCTYSCTYHLITFYTTQNPFTTTIFALPGLGEGLDRAWQSTRVSWLVTAKTSIKCQKFWRPIFRRNNLICLKMSIHQHLMTSHHYPCSNYLKTICTWESPTWAEPCQANSACFHVFCFCVFVHFPDKSVQDPNRLKVLHFLFRIVLRPSKVHTSYPPAHALADHLHTRAPHVTLSSQHVTLKSCLLFCRMKMTQGFMKAPCSRSFVSSAMKKKHEKKLVTTQWFSGFRHQDAKHHARNKEIQHVGLVGRFVFGYNSLCF